MTGDMWLATYDITNGKVLSRVSKLLSRYMVRMQRSVFAGILSDSQVSEIHKAVTCLLGERDEFAIIHICKADVGKMMFLQKPIVYESMMEDCLVW